MRIDLKGFTALITGASGGMGYEMAKTLLEHGATVVISSRAGEKLNSAYISLNNGSNSVYAVPLDVTDENSVEEAAAWFKERFSKLDMLVNNAGIGANAPGMEDLPREHAFWDIPVSAVRKVIETNLTGLFTVTSKFVPMMIRQGYGQIVYVSTSDATITNVGQIPYGPSKGGAEAMAGIMSKELNKYGINVNVICPGGFTDTNMAGKGAKEFMLKNNRPILTPDVLNGTILFLASPAAAGLNGEKIVGKDLDKWLDERGYDMVE